MKYLAPFSIINIFHSSIDDRSSSFSTESKFTDKFVNVSIKISIYRNPSRFYFVEMDKKSEDTIPTVDIKARRAFCETLDKTEKVLMH